MTAYPCPSCGGSGVWVRAFCLTCNEPHDVPCERCGGKGTIPEARAPISIRPGGAEL